MNKKDKKDKKDMDMVNHPPHYERNGAMECIDEMILIFGKEATKNFCLCNAWKYRYRASAKNGDEDYKKSDWYIQKYKELCEAPAPRYTMTIDKMTILDGKTGETVLDLSNNESSLTGQMKSNC